MANGDGDRRGGGFGGGGGARSDQDEASWNDRSYRRGYDPNDSENTGSRYDEQYRQQQMGFEHADDNQYDARNRQSSVIFWPGPGKFIIPRMPNGEVANSWAAHDALVSDERNGLTFNPDKYPLFDGIIFEKFPQIDHPRYAGLLKNLAILRNDTYSQLLDDGSFDPGDEIHVPKIVAIATALGDALANDKWYKRIFTRSLDADVANIEGVGAAEMYKYLLSIQSEPGFFQNFIDNIRSLIGLPNHNFGIGGLEQTPFTDDNLRAAPPVAGPSPDTNPDKGAGPDAPATGMSVPPVPVPPGDAVGQMVALSEKMGNTATQFQSMASLQEPERKQAVVEAHTILRWLKNLQFTDVDMETWLDQGTPPEQVAKAEALEQLVRIYTGQLQVVQRENPAFMRSDAIVEDASNAAGAMALAVIEHTLNMLPDGHPSIPKLEALADALPEKAEILQNQSVMRLIETMEIGMERATGQQVSDVAPLERLLTMSRRSNNVAYTLKRPVSEMEPPRRREAIDLAHEILRRLREMSFSESPMEKIIDSGSLQDKAALAQKVAEMVEIYQNKLFEAAQVSPAIFSDPRIQEANDAVGSFAYAIKLMAAKEMPNSIAAAQQISAEAAQMPEQWKHLEGRLAERLKSVESGLAAAHEAIEARQQEQQQQQQNEDQQVQTEQALSDQTRRKKRRRRSGSSSGLTRSAKRRNAGDLNGDGVADKFQGLNLGQESRAIRLDSRPVTGKSSKAEKPAALTQSFDPKDMETIRKLGGDLHKISKDMRDISNSLASVSPDDKNFAARSADRDLQQPQKPKGI